MPNSEQNQSDRTEITNPIANALSKIVDRNAASPEHVYRLAVIVEGLLDHLDDPGCPEHHTRRTAGTH